jgi:hypothetical protein
MPCLLRGRSPIVVEAVAVAYGRRDELLDVDVVEADDANIDVLAAKQVGRIDPIVDMDAAAWTEEMVRDRIAAAIVRHLA